MTTTNANGIVFVEDTDPISPFQVLLNTLQQGTSDAISSTARVFPVANVPARDALEIDHPPSASSPLFVFRADAGAGRELEYTTDGTTWRTVHSGQTPGVGVRASGTTFGPSTWGEAATITNYPFIKDSWYELTGIGTVSIGGASATLSHRVRAFGVDVSPVHNVTMGIGSNYNIANSYIFKPASSTTVNVALEVNIPAPATGVVANAGCYVSVKKIA
jgi:hypothetical protein